MDIMLHQHHAKHICDVPEGLRELCVDISREVIRCAPYDICLFIAEYLDTLIVTRENAKIAIQIVQNITLKSEQILEILTSSGLQLKQIAAVAPRLQKAFRAYLEAVDAQDGVCTCGDSSDELYKLDDESEVSICGILRQTGTSMPEAQRAAIKIQALFRGHYERMMQAEKRGEVQWQRAAANTIAILKKCGITRQEAAYAATVIQAAYRGYYTRRHLRKVHAARIKFKEWLAMMEENTGLTLERAQEAAITIQRYYRKYRARKYPGDAISKGSKAGKDETVTIIEYSASAIVPDKSEVDDESTTTGAASGATSRSTAKRTDTAYEGSAKTMSSSAKGEFESLNQAQEPDDSSDKNDTKDDTDTDDKGVKSVESKGTKSQATAGSGSKATAGSKASVAQSQATAGSKASVAKSQATAGSKASVAQSQATAGSKASAAESKATAGSKASVAQSQATAGSKASVADSKATASGSKATAASGSKTPDTGSKATVTESKTTDTEEAK